VPEHLSAHRARPGRISLVDEDAGYHRNAADLGVACSSGQVFPLDEGVTGQAAAGRRRY
jgi:hypothetical protein